MPAPITHIVLTEKVFKKHFSSKNRAEFLIGTSLPDIRYFGNLDREKTHFFDLKLADIKNEDSFKAGFKFHSLVDEVHNSFFSLRENPFFLEPIEITAVSLKFFEDELFYDYISSWVETSDFFDKSLKEEIAVVGSKEDVMDWHEALKDYFLIKPNPESRRKVLEKTNFSDDLALQIEKFIEQMKKMPQVKESVLEFYNNFEQLIS